MYASTGHSASWAYDNEDFHSADDYSSPSPKSDSDSDQELRDVEELLYSHVHYEPNFNFLCAAGSVDDLCPSEVHITHVNDSILDRLDISAAGNSQDSEVVVIDEQEQQEEIGQTTSFSSNISVQLKRKSKSGKTDESDGETRTKSKKVDAAGSALPLSLIHI